VNGVLICGRRFDDLDLLASHDVRARPLGAEHESLVVTRAAVQKIRIAVGCERVQFVVPGSAEHAIGTPAAEERVVTLVARHGIRSSVARGAVVPVPAEHLVGVGAAVESVVAISARHDVVSTPAVHEVVAIGCTGSVVAGSCPNVVGASSRVDGVVSGERMDLIRLLRPAEHVVAGSSVDHGCCCDCGESERSRGRNDREHLASHSLSFRRGDGRIERHVRLGEVCTRKARRKCSVRTV